MTLAILYNILWVLNIIFSVLLIVIVLLQTGKGSEVGFAFGAGAAQTMFGASGGKSVITNATIILAVCFMVTSVVLAFMQFAGGHSFRGSSAFDRIPQQQQQQAPAQQPVTPK